MQQAASQPPQNQQKERVSLDIKDWLKLNLD